MNIHNIAGILNLFTEFSYYTRFFVLLLRDLINNTIKKITVKGYNIILYPYICNDAGDNVINGF